MSSAILSNTIAWAHYEPSRLLPIWFRVQDSVQVNHAQRRQIARASVSAALTRDNLFGGSPFGGANHPTGRALD
jgi:hypothetical protein